MHSAVFTEYASAARKPHSRVEHSREPARGIAEPARGCPGMSDRDHEVWLAAMAAGTQAYALLLAEGIIVREQLAVLVSQYADAMVAAHRASFPGDGT